MATSIASKNEIRSMQALEEHLKQCWEPILSKSPMIQLILNGCTDRRLYALYLIETYHYTKHNAKNQALVAVRFQGEHNPYLQFCLRHAADEAGHELMAVHDLKVMGIDPAHVTQTQPMPATEVLVAYLYWASVQGNPYQRLGYSFWAENCYHAIGPVLQAIKSQMNIRPEEMTFFIDHATIDVKHAEMVRQMIEQTAKTPEDWQAITRVMELSLQLTGNILNDVYDEYQALVQGTSTKYAFLNGLQ